MPLMSGGDAVVRSILGHGISTIYCLPGVQSDHLFNAMFDVGDALTVVHTRHEQGAAYMALGAALATGKPAAYSVVPGPGFLNSTAALATAYSTGAQGARAGRPDPELRHRQGPRLPARDPRPDRHPAQADKIGRAVGHQPQDAPGMIGARSSSCDRDGRGRSAWKSRPTCCRHAPRSSCPPLALDPEPALDEEAIARAADLLAKAEPGDLRRRRCAGRGRRGARARPSGSPRRSCPIGAAGRARRPPPAQPRCRQAGMCSGRGRRRARGRHAAAIAAQHPGASTTISS